MIASGGLPVLGADVVWGDAAAAAAVEVATSPGAGRLGAVVRWWAATCGSAEPDPPRSPRAVVLSDAPPYTGPGPLPSVGPPTPATTEEAFTAGVALADELADDHCDLLVVGGGPRTATDAVAVLVCAITGAEPVALLPRGADAGDSGAWIDRAARLRDRLRSVRMLREQPDQLLAALDDPELTLAAGLVMRAIARRVPLVLDGPVAAAAAVLCHSTQARTGEWWLFADAHPDLAHRRVVQYLHAQPVLDLGIAGGSPVAGALVVGVIGAAVGMLDRHHPSDHDSDSDSDSSDDGGTP